MKFVRGVKCIARYFFIGGFVGDSGALGSLRNREMKKAIAARDQAKSRAGSAEAEPVDGGPVFRLR